jgi:hypothetical protein
MQRVIIISEQEFIDLKHDIITEIHNFSKQRYGFKMVSRDTGEDVTDDMQVLGMLMHPINRVCAKHFGEVE